MPFRCLRIVEGRDCKETGAPFADRPRNPEPCKYRKQAELEKDLAGVVAAYTAGVRRGEKGTQNSEINSLSCFQ